MATTAVDADNVTTEECLEEPISLPLVVPLTFYTDQPLSSLDVLNRWLHRMESIHEGLSKVHFLLTYYVLFF